MVLSIFYVLSAVALLIALVTLFKFFRQANKLNLLHSALDEQQQVNQQMQSKLRQFQEEIYEVREGTLGVGSRLKQLNAEIEVLQNNQQELANQEPGSKLYNQAAKLVSAGADIETLMQECELPRAEAELLYNLHKKQHS